MATNEVTLDIIEDARWREVNGQVVEIVRLAIVNNIANIPASNPADRMLQLARSVGGIPQPGASHPWRGDCFLREREVTAFGHGQARIMLVYRPDNEQQDVNNAYTTRGGSSSEQIETQLDKQGNQIIVTHQGKQQGGEIHPFEARSEIQAWWYEQSMTPGDLTRAFTNKVNSGPFQLDLLAPARTWRCTEVTFEPEDMSLSPPKYRYQASFVYNPAKHDPSVVYIDPETGKPPPALVVGQGIKTITWYDEVNFDLLLP